MGPSTVDELLKKYGGDPGRYQIFVFILLWFSMYSLSLNNLINLFITGAYPHHCKVPVGQEKNQTLPYDLTLNDFDSCYEYANSSNHNEGKVSCTNGWEYFPPNDEWSIVQEWDLVCDKHYQTALATTIYFAGVTVGSAIFGFLSDLYGRKPILISSLLAHIVISITGGFSVNYVMYVVFRCLDGFALQGAFGSAYVLCVELFQPSRRTTVAICCQILWSLTVILLTGLFYFFKNWKTVYFIINVPFVVTISYIWLVPESIRWLLALKKLPEAKVELQRLARYNKIFPSILEEDLEEDIKIVAKFISKEIQHSEKLKQSYGFLDLFKLKKMRIISCLSFYFYIVSYFSFYAIAFASTGLKVNLYLNFVCIGFIELMIIITMYFILQRIGRKTVSWIVMAICSTISFLAVLLLLTLPEDDVSQMTIAILAALGRATLAGYFCSMPIYSSELSPTVLRNLLNGIANFWGRIGSMVAPQVMLLELYVWKPFPFLICAILSFFGAGLTFLLPETKDKPLPDVPEDVEWLWTKGGSKKQAKSQVVSDKINKAEFSPLTFDVNDENFY